MKSAIFVKITDGPSHSELSEDRCENLMDMRTRWNISFPLEGKEKSIAAENVTRVTPENKIFSPRVAASARRVINSRASRNLCSRRQKMRYAWRMFMKSASLQPESHDFHPENAIWRFVGRSHFWGFCPSAIVFGEYDALERRGYALITVNLSERSRLVAEFPNSIQGFSISSEEEELLIEKW